MINSEYVLFSGLLSLIIIDLLRNRLHVESRKIVHYFTLAILLFAFLAELLWGDLNVYLFSSVAYSTFVNGFILFLAVVIYTFLLSDSKDHSAFIDFLFVLATLGATLVVISSNFISLVIAIEMISIASYGLVFFGKSNRQMEGAVKYVSISFISMVIMIFGVSLIYGGTGTLDFIQTSLVNYLPFVAGLVFVMVGLAFKSTIVPFHMWAPDVYEASNGAVTAFLSSISKAAGLIAMVRVFFFAFPLSSQFVSIVFILLAVSTIFFASFLATVQDRVKRILAYSSIAQAGFAFVSIALLNKLGVQAAVFYIFSFAIADALVFLAYKIFEDNGVVYKKDIKKMFSVSKAATVGLFLGVLSLAGIPPTIGFFGKLLIFTALLSNLYIFLVIALFAITLFSAFYYFGLLRELDFSRIPTKIVRNYNLRAKECLILILTASLFAGVTLINFV